MAKYKALTGSVAKGLNGQSTHYQTAVRLRTVRETERYKYTSLSRVPAVLYTWYKEIVFIRPLHKYPRASDFAIRPAIMLHVPLSSSPETNTR